MAKLSNTGKKPKNTKTTAKFPQESARSLIIKAIQTIGLLFLAGIASPVSQLNLSPVFGSIPASLYHQGGLTLTIIVGMTIRTALKPYVSLNLSKSIPLVAFWTPVVHWLLFQYSVKLGNDSGPLLIESLTYFPLLFLCVDSAISSIIVTKVHPTTIDTISEFASPMTAYIAVSMIAKHSNTFLSSVIGSSIVFTRVALQLLLASSAAILKPSFALVFAFPAILHTLWMNPHLATEHGLRVANAKLQATQNYTILARRESITGYISVMQNTAEFSFCLMRCDHSLLGGEWLVTPEASKLGQIQRETVFAVFVLLEAVRLIEPLALESTSTSPDSLLNIGLGIGTAPNAFMAHGINTTIVELDPMVHQYASEYFNLNPKHTAVIQDAVTYVAEKSITNPASFKYIIHDVFTGGAEPVYLFTAEFLRGLYNLLSDDGAVAINYAGDLTLGSTKLVLNTIHAIFPACRIFRDAEPQTGLKSGEPDFINMVVFCVKQNNGKGKKAVKFRKATDEDFLGSIARRNFLQPNDEFEVMFNYVPEKEGGKVMGEKHVAELERYHDEGAVSHWKLMRTVLPEGVWEMW